MGRRYANLGILIAAIIAAAALTTSFQQKSSALLGVNYAKQAPIATSSNNVYVAWPSNSSGNVEIMFRASTDNGKTFGSKIDLSNSTETDSIDQEIAASANNVYVSWWEVHGNGTREPVLVVSNDNGKTFGEKIMLSNNATTAKPLP